VPEWYLLPFYAILRAIPDKLGGVIAMGAAIGVLFLIPWLDTSRVRAATFRPIYKQFFWILLADVIVLGWIGANPAEGYYILIGQIATTYYFLHFLVIMPFVGWFESPRQLPDSISSSVLEKGGGSASGKEAAQ
jgi:ubiquinol-cytochrome c reductase cytochrome b subunit